MRALTAYRRGQHNARQAVLQVGSPFGIVALANNACGKFLGCIYGTGCAKVLDGGATDNAERCAIDVRSLVVHGQSVVAAVKGALEAECSVAIR